MIATLTGYDTTGVFFDDCAVVTSENLSDDFMFMKIAAAIEETWRVFDLEEKRWQFHLARVKEEKKKCEKCSRKEQERRIQNHLRSYAFSHKKLCAFGKDRVNRMRRLQRACC